MPAEEFLLADFDIEQRSCLRWQAQRKARALKPEIDVAKFSKQAKLEQVADRYDVVVMDTRGRYDELSLELAKTSDVIFLPCGFSMDDISPTLNVIAEFRSEGIASSHVAVVFCRTGDSQRQAQHARSILRMNNIIALEAVLPQRDGFASLSGTGRTGREAQGAALQTIATAMDQALLQFIETATSGACETTAAIPAEPRTEQVC